MRIEVISDLHLEFDKTFTLRNTEDADVLILAGDVCEARNHKLLHRFMGEVSSEYDNVLYVFGNHEYYDSDLDQVNRTRDELAKYSNVHILDNDYIEIDEVEFAGTTLWTDLKKEDWFAVDAAKRGINDFRLIEDLSVSKWIHMNEIARDFLKQVDVDVVITHFVPFEKFIHPTFVGNQLNYSFVNTDMKWLVYNSDAALWVFGHTHYPVDEEILDTRFICNPKGYDREIPYLEKKVVEV